MKKLTFLLLLMAACLCCLQVSAQPAKAPKRSNVYSYLPSGYIGLGTYDNPNHIYYSTQRQQAVPLGNVYGISIIGEVEGKYYSTTYAKANSSNSSDAGAGFIAAMKVQNGTPVICDCQSGTSENFVNFSARVEPAGEYAARIVYTLSFDATIWNLLVSSRTVSLGVWADIMIGNNDNAPIYCLRNDQGQVYGLDMKYKSEEEAAEGEKIPVFTALFGAGLNGVTPVNDYWFGQFRNNYEVDNDRIVGEYDNLCDIQHGSGDNATFDYDVPDEFFMEEGGNYDSGMGFCWKNITLSRGESIELSFLVSASEIDIEEEPVEPDPEEEYNVEVYNTEAWNDLPADHPARVWGYYKHPFGLTGHMEYMVDGDRGTGEWTAIEGDLISDAAFDLSFNLNFNPDVDDIHTLKLRINDGQDNYRYLTELDKEWEDIRTIDLTVNPETQYYDATPKTFVVTVGGVIDYTLGENGEYVEPGTYDFSIYGDYDMGTIGINTVEFSIVRRQAALDVVVPEDCVYDGEEHAATATMDGDGTVIITYKDAEGNISTDAPVEPGTYEVFVEVTDGEFYDGIENTSYGEFTIDKRQTEIDVVIPEDCIYDGNEHAATVTVVDGDGDVTVTYVNAETGEAVNGVPVEPGTYNVIVEVAETEHYYGIESTVCGQFTISKMESELVVIVPEDCIYDGNEHAATVIYNGDGNVIVTYKDSETRGITTDAPVEPGTYEVFVEVTAGEHYGAIENKSYGEFTIDRRPCEFELTEHPQEREKYVEGKSYGATVVVPEGSGNYTITYLDLTNPNSEPTTTPPSAVGRYAIILFIDDSGAHYYGTDEPTIVWQFEIYADQTALSELNADSMDNGAWYTIDGRRVAAPTEPGIYIHNGKKFFVK